jgi:FKBP-type peptidyl-prolyl cis-trans isomerase
MIKKYLFFSLALMSTIIFNACEKEVDEGFSDEMLRLNAYMSINYPNLTPTSSGLYYIIEQGTGSKPSSGDYLLFDYTGQNLNDVVYETTLKATAELYDIYAKSTRYIPSYVQYKGDFNQLIKGLEEGFSLLNEGAKARFIMPSSLAYGTKAYKNLYPYSSVIIDVEFKRLVKDPYEYEIELISNYIAENYPNLVVSEVVAKLNEDGVFVLEQEEKEVEDDEDGDESPYFPIEDKDVVSVYYAGRFTDNWLFDTNIKSVAEENGTYDVNRTYDPLKVTIGGTTYIEGFSLSLKKLKTNTLAKVIILSKHAYGAIGTEQIPAHTPLIFDLDVLTKTTNTK